MRCPVIAFAALVMGAGALSSCDIGGASSSPAQRPAPTSATPAVSDAPVPGRLHHKGDKKISIIFDVRGEGRADITYALHAGDTPTRETVAIPWTHTFQGALTEPGLSPTLTARNTDPTGTIECQITTTQLSFSGSKPAEPGAVARCSVKVLGRVS
jgi:hypothetical protein